jgi:hypothetical protein
MCAAIMTLHVLLLRFFIEKFSNQNLNLFGEDPFLDSEMHNL